VNAIKEIIIKKPINLLLLSVFLLTALAAGNVLAGYNEDLKTVYHVYVDGEKIGTVNDTSLVDELVKNKALQLQDEYPNYEIVVKEDLALVPEKVFSLDYNNEQVLAKLNHKISLAVKATALVVNDKIIGYVEDDTAGQAVIHNMLTEFAPEEIVDQIENLEYKNTNEIESKLNAPTIIDVTLSEKVSLIEDRTLPNEILSVDEAIELLKKGTLTDTIHKVEPGESLSVIASDYNLTVGEVLELNSEISDPSKIQQGQELIVTDYEPYVKVTVTKAVTRDEDINFTTKYETDSTMYKGTSKVKQYGQLGKKRIDYIITTENGVVVEQEVVNEEVIKESVTKIVVSGTKVIPSRGTGEFIWPTYGGVITSYQGMRWGKYHKGIDISGVSNRNIKAIDNGTVSVAAYGWNNGRGNYVVINHNNGFTSHYFHFSQLYVTPGQVVMKGQAIGKMGTTGRSTGVHLHIELYKHGSLLNPLDYLRR
jgi:murein DD-endopeptidase MepM/ murein hydrolase activator NlpD